MPPAAPAETAVTAVTAAERVYQHVKQGVLMDRRYEGGARGPGR
ncbi:hypothetical protein ABZZ20_19560 [Streptomyces sp. NPDC006430]